MPRFPLFCNGAYRAASPVADDEQTINWYPEIMEKEAPAAVAPIILMPTPGSELFLNVTEVIGGRGALAMAARCFFVIGSKLVEVKTDQTYIIRGEVGNDGRPARLSSSGINGEQMIIASAGQVYCYDLKTDAAPALVLTLDDGISNDITLPPATDTDEDGASYFSHVGLSYSFFQALNRVASEFRISNSYNGMIWDALEFQARATQSDPWLALHVTSYGETWLLGQHSSEVWYNNANPDFPYAPDPSGALPYGIAAPYSVCEAGDQLCWLATTRAGDLAVLAMRGVTPARISDFALEAEFDTYQTVADAEGETYRQGGHTFFKLTFPTERKTWLFDFQTVKWHRRGTWVSSDKDYDEWHPTWYAFFDGKHLWCERNSGRIVQVDTTILTDVDGTPLRRLRRSPTIRMENKLMVHKRLEVLIEAGLGPAVNPQMMLRFSDDGGKTWENELMQPMGNTGEYRQRMVWEKLGQSLARTYELSCTEAVPVRVIDAFLEAE